MRAILLILAAYAFAAWSDAQAGHTLQGLVELTHLGKMIIEDTSTPTLSGAE